MTILVVPPHPEIEMDQYHAEIGQSVIGQGKTAGDAIGSAVKAWEAQGNELTPSRIFFKKWGGDEFFSDEQIARMQALITKRNQRLETGSDLSDEEFTELDTLISEELTAQGKRIKHWVTEAGK